MRPFAGRRVLLAVAGGIAAYKAAELARLLAQAGAVVDVLLTESGARFVGPTTFEALTGRPVRTSLWARALDHIELARAADLAIVAPATADLLARLAAGRADDLVTTTLLATTAPVLLAPAMNTRMLEHPGTQRNLATLRAWGHHVVGPEYGPLAEPEEGWGRMSEPETILAHAGRLLEGRTPWSGRWALVTAGPTREPVDAVRVLTNRSSGRMGYALAAALWRRGAEVELVTGPTELAPPVGPAVRRVETAEEMCAQVVRSAPEADALFMVAAVADFRPRGPGAGKLRRREGPPALELELTPDVLAAARPRLPAHALAVAFALEVDPEGAVERAEAKRAERGLDCVVLNVASEPGAGFEVETNRVTLCLAGGRRVDLPPGPKAEVAEAILDHLEPLLRPAP
jgi:phosphopantothenoylcysteine decarboxylase/phosphopantothenate--cysteine ligase